MKRLTIVSVLFVLLLTGCSPRRGKGDLAPFDPVEPESEEYTPKEDADPFPEYEAPEIDTSSFTLDNIPVNFTAVNDFHGQVDEESGDHRVGLAKMSTYLKDRKAKGDILISSGDMYQGSFLAGIDKGQFVSHAFKNIGFDAYVLGNHEFDYGVHALADNQLAIGQNFIGANIYRYPYDAKSPEKYSIGDDYKIINLYEGTPFEVKVGIIGVIGKNQISSIKSTYTSNFVFIEPTEIVKDLSVKLREQEGCDFVIASYHDDAPDKSIANTVKGKTYKYVDACFMAHTHKYLYELVNNVPFIQGSAYSRGVSYANFTFNKNTKQIYFKYGRYQYLDSLSLEEDSLMKEKIEEKRSSYKDEYTNVIGVNNAGELSVDRMAQFYAKVTFKNLYSYAKTEGLNVIGAMFNDARRSLKAGEFTYADLYGTHPFLNDIYILSAIGKDILTEKEYSFGFIDPDINIDKNKYYDIVVYDYNGFHISIDNSYNKYYNYFPSAFKEGCEHKPFKVSLSENYTCIDAALSYLNEYHTIDNSFFNEKGFFG